jgi:hypothetical protein
LICVASVDAESNSHWSKTLDTKCA